MDRVVALRGAGRLAGTCLSCRDVLKNATNRSDFENTEGWRDKRQIVLKSATIVAVLRTPHDRRSDPPH